MSATSPRMPGSTWHRLGSADPSLLLNTRLTVHHAVQLLASFGQTLVEPLDDDSHRSMTWDGDVAGFRSQPSSHGLRAGLRLADFTLELLREGQTLEELDLHGRTQSDARGWLGGAVGRARGGDAVEMAWPEYDMPERPGGPDGALELDDGVLVELADWYGGAGLALAPLTETTEASELRCWPHHFDLATLLTFPPGEAGGEAKYVGVGFSPGDEARPHPYYYVNGWPAPAPEDLPDLDGPGSWNTEGWVGAVLESEEIVALDGTRREATVRDFLDAAVSAMRAAVLPQR